jgi:hypothetical protein
MTAATTVNFNIIKTLPERIAELVLTLFALLTKKIKS